MCVHEVQHIRRRLFLTKSKTLQHDEWDDDTWWDFLKEAIILWAMLTPLYMSSIRSTLLSILCSMLSSVSTFFHSASLFFKLLQLLELIISFILIQHFFRVFVWSSRLVTTKQRNEIERGREEKTGNKINVNFSRCRCRSTFFLLLFHTRK